MPTDRWIRWASAFAFAALLLSFRRSFWVGAALGFVLVLLFATGRRGGRVLLPTVIIIAIASVVTLVLAGFEQLVEPDRGAGKALSPSQISLNADDRYRIEERRNVLHSVLKRPVFGLGIGVPWVVNRPISLAFTGQEQHQALLPLWWWMKMGILGLFAYFWLMATAMYMGFCSGASTPMACTARSASLCSRASPA